jgi:hypothetical protein
MRFVQLPIEHGMIYVNPETVRVVRPRGAKAAIYFDGSDHIEVMCSAEAAIGKLSQEG